MEVYKGYTGRIKNVGEGFYTKNSISAHIKSANIAARELDEEVDKGLWAEGYRAIISIPADLIGSAINLEGNNSMPCKSLAQAHNILSAAPHKNKAVKIAVDDGWHLSPNGAAKDAIDELMHRIESRK